MADKPQVEVRDVSPKVVWTLWLSFAVFIAATALGLRLFFSPDHAWTFNHMAKPEPRLQISPAADYETFARTKAAALTEYGWRDRSAGLAIIPIEQAMRLVSEGHRAETQQPAACVGAACPGAIPSAKTFP